MDFLFDELDDFDTQTELQTLFHFKYVTFHAKNNRDMHIDSEWVR